MTYEQYMIDLIEQTGARNFCESEYDQNVKRTSTT